MGGRNLSRWRVPLGFLVAIPYFLLARPTFRSLIVGGIVGLAGLLYRAWAAGTIKKNRALATEGPYAYSRNPLYFGSFLLALGFGAASSNIYLFVGIVIFFLLLYWPVMRQEERELERLFGEAFLDYARRAPLFLPWKGKFKSGEAVEKFSWRQYWRNREYNALLGFVGAVVLLLIIKQWRG